MMIADAFGFFSGDLILKQTFRHQLDSRLELRLIDVLTLAGLPSMDQRVDDCSRAEDARVGIHIRRAELHRRHSRVTRGVEKPGECRGGRSVAEVPAIRSVLAVAG